jgi:hypothetical protein
MKISRGAGYFFSCSKDRGATFKKKIIEFDPFLAKLEKIIFIWEFLRKKKIEIFLKDYRENYDIFHYILVQGILPYFSVKIFLKDYRENYDIFHYILVQGILPYFSVKIFLKDYGEKDDIFDYILVQGIFH